MQRILLLLAFVIASHFAAAQTIPLTITDKGFLLLKVMANDSILGTFLFDTGGGLEVVSGKFLEKIGQSAVQVGIGTGFRHNGERLDLETYRIPSLSFGQMRIEQPVVGVYKPLDNFGIDGLISLHAFANQPFTIDFKNSELRLETPETLAKAQQEGQTIPVKLNVHLDWGVDMFIPICLNDSVTVDAEFDTGTPFGNLWVHPYYAKKAGVDLAAPGVKKENYTNSCGKQKEVFYASIAKVGVCGIPSAAAANFPVSFKEELIYNALVSAEFFKNRQVTIDVAGRRLTVR